MSSTVISWEQLLAEFDALGDSVPDAAQYQRFCTLAIEHPIAREMAGFDPFSREYADRAMALYLDLRGRQGSYDVHRDEESGSHVPDDFWSAVSPWGFGDTNLIADFLLAWGWMMRLLALPPGRPARVLEYGTGSGQFLLFLARAGVSTFAVDIDQASLDQLRAQADAMKLDVRTERARFGDGFAVETFDRIVFFEAFHHAFDFMALLVRLQDRLSPGGRVLFCGEPIVEAPQPVVPYAWGLRLDALSVFSIRRHGWMELGFTRPFFVDALHRAGWWCEHHPFPHTGRALAFVARSCLDQPVDLGAPVELGRHAAGWWGAEGTHRCARRRTATLALPTAIGAIKVEIALFNPLPVARTVRLTAGLVEAVAEIPPHADRFAMSLDVAGQEEIAISCDPICIDELVHNGDERFIGAIVRTVLVRRV